jgi:serpin B
MKSNKHILVFGLALAIMGCSCSQDIISPEFDYNLKSAKVIETNNEFGLELLKTVFDAEEKANVMISPTSVSIALGMAYNGAETSTREAFEEVLNYQGLTREEVNEITRELIHVLLTNVSGNLLEIANSMWYDEGFPVEPEFINLNSHYFDAEVRELDFRSAEAVNTINDWVSSKTHGKIDEIIDSIDPAVMMFLINAIYFNCVWETEFDPDDTHQADFYNEDGSLFGQVDMMHLESTFRVSNQETFRAIELPYKNGKFSMLLFLPDEESSVYELVQELDGTTWKNWMDSFSEQEDFKVYMPRFEFEFDRSLGDDLKSMGLDIAFSPQEADFSGISSIALYIADVIHKTYIKVNEEGTEAAAVTAVVMELTSIQPMSELRFDRPFLFAITENSSRSILFAGKVAEPAYE